MKLGIVHLSDIHFRKGEFSSLDDKEMAHAISSAVRTELIGTTHVLIIVSGDIAYSGNEEEYNYASDWISELYMQIDDGCDATCWIICSPGNHDVDHSDKRKLRSVLIDRIHQEPELSTDREIVDECTTEQTAFFSFRDGLEGSEILVHSDPLLRIYRIRDDKSVVQINALNTAWMSLIKEKPGSIVFPIEHYRQHLQKPDGFAISVLHHPLGWFTPENSRQMRNELSVCSSVILFGHEHIPDSTRILNKMGDHVRIVDGGVLREDDPNSSSFNLLLLDTKACLVKSFIFRKSRERYECPKCEDWHDATRLTSSESDRFRLNANARSRLEDIGANIIHSRQEQLSLRDLFVYPDLRPVNTDEVVDREQEERTISAETIIFDSETTHVLLEGDESSGKSALLRMYFLEYYQRGKIPLYVDGRKLGSRDTEGLRILLRRIYSNTYDGEDYTTYEQLERSHRVLLIDDYMFEGVNSELQEEFFAFAHQFAAVCIVTTRDLLSLERYATMKEGLSFLQEFNTFVIREFGHVKRDELIKRWLLLGRQTRDWNTLSTLTERERIRLVINTTIGRSLMPSVPIFLLTILQSTEMVTPSSIRSTYGHYYEFLITSTLMESGVRPEDLDAFSNYISELAFTQYYAAQKREISAKEYLAWHESFCSMFGINWESDRIQRRLENANILVVESTGTICFKYQYVYYFFLAKRLAGSIEEEFIRDRIRHMCNRLHIVEYANIALFLIHHSNDKFVLDCIQHSAKSLLCNQQMFEFEISMENRVLETVNKLPSPLGVQILEERDPEVEQNKALREQDRVETIQEEMQEVLDEEDELEEQPMDALDILAQAGVAAKTVELVGQILRNYYGSLRIETKLGLGTDAIDLALRALFSFIDLLLTDDVEIVNVLIEARRRYETEELKSSARKNDRELERWARDLAFAILRIVAQIIIRKVACALGSEQLKSTLERLVPDEASLTYKMIEIAALLDDPMAIPREKISEMAKRLENNPFGFQLLRDLAAQRVYRYPMEYKDKQWLAGKLNFSMARQRSADLDRSRRLLPG